MENGVGPELDEETMMFVEMGLVTYEDLFGVDTQEDV